MKTVLRISGVLLIVIGLMFLPGRNHVFDKGDQSAFSDVAELGAFLHAALGMVVVGSVLFGLSFLIRGDLSD